MWNWLNNTVDVLPVWVSLHSSFRFTIKKWRFFSAFKAECVCVKVYETINKVLRNQSKVARWIFHVFSSLLILIFSLSFFLGALPHKVSSRFTFFKFCFSAILIHSRRRRIFSLQWLNSLLGVVNVFLGFN